jgi:Ca2+-binding RTX toxin-like protein
VDELQGGEGDDSLDGGEGDDILSGGKTTIRWRAARATSKAGWGRFLGGGGGRDVYFYAIGDSSDTISDSAGNTSG